MTILNNTSIVERVGNGSATVFSFSPMQIFEESHLQVTIAPADGSTPFEVTLGTGATNFSVNGDYPSATAITGSITYPASGGTPLASGDKIFIKRVVPFLQELDLENQGGYLPELQEGAFDTGLMWALQIQEAVDRSVKVGIGSGVDPDALIAAIEQAKDDAEAAELAAQTAQSGAVTAQGLAEGARDDARDWASEAEDVAVNDGVNPSGFSAFHWSEKAAASADNAAAAVGNVLISSADTTSGKLNDKIVAGNGLVKSILNGGGDEDLQLAADYATKPEAEAGTNNTKVMTPLRTKEAIDAQVSDAIASQSFGAVGTYAYAYIESTGLIEGATVAGSSLQPASAWSNTTSAADDTNFAGGWSKGGSTLSGTWRYMSRSNVSSASSRVRMGIFLRIS